MIRRPIFTPDERYQVWLDAKGCCSLCGVFLAAIWQQRNEFKILDGVIHHKLPLYLGGYHKPHNWTILCIPCHKHIHKTLSKNDSFKQWREDRLAFFGGEYAEAFISPSPP